MTFAEDLRRALDALPKPLNVFFRDDDAADDIPQLRQLLDLFAAHDTAALTVTVIPYRLTAAVANLLCSRRALQRVEVSQHGYSHVNHEPSGGRRAEFGPAWPYSDQLQNMVEGRNILDDAFGSRGWYKAFSPPWNHCSEDCLKVLDLLGYRVLSRGGRRSNLKHRVVEIPITLDVFEWDGKTRFRGESEIAAEMVSQVKAGQRIGILLHHQAMHEEAFRTIGALLGVLQHPQVRICTFEGLAG